MTYDPIDYLPYDFANRRHIGPSPKEMAEKTVIYALSITMESINRMDNFGLEPPNLDNILSMDRILSYKLIRPEFIKLLKDACIIREAEKGWFQNIKEKFISG